MLIFLNKLQHYLANATIRDIKSVKQAAAFWMLIFLSTNSYSLNSNGLNIWKLFSSSGPLFSKFT